MSAAQATPINIPTLHAAMCQEMWIAAGCLGFIGSTLAQRKNQMQQNYISCKTLSFPIVLVEQRARLDLDKSSKLCA
jgi:hypothetical protein